MTMIDEDFARALLRALRPGPAAHCLQCGEALPQSQSQGRPKVYCDRCRNERLHPKPLHTVCQYKPCGKALPEKRNKNLAFCSKPCFDRARREDPELKEIERVRRSKRYRADPEKAKADRTAHRRANAEHERERQRAYRTENPELKAATDARRRARKLDLTPPLTPEEKVQERVIYAEAQAKGWHVDHIKSLAKGGLHHPDNLVAIPPVMNMSKGAQYWPDLAALK